ncbi:MAG: kinase-like domain-containing protein [Olpidium bornovanus]|uniref:Kinase-like domain-containing protein n=1 Tax=Olpidium bornovanus TaxID=278681 RepID=A0A8H7ZRN4_9FUNG|nr:MAG: kinase-like domain-containing protein [Olpidium bornovanus]
MKIVNRRRIATLDMVNRVRREIQYLKLLRHPHIIKLYEVITTPTDRQVIAEAEHNVICNVSAAGQMPEDGARRFFQQIISAVEYCHRHRIVHRLAAEEILCTFRYNMGIPNLIR